MLLNWSSELETGNNQRDGAAGGQPDRACREVGHSGPATQRVVVGQASKGRDGADDQRRDEGVGHDGSLDAQGEEWRPVVGYEGKYEVSSIGRVRSIRRLVAGGRYWNNGKLLSPWVTKQGYLVVGLGRTDTGGRSSVHRLVAIAFLPKPRKNQTDINHIDGIKSNNVASNLEWCTRSENTKHAIRLGLFKPTVIRGQAVGTSKLKTSQAIEIRRRAQTESRRALAAEFSVCPQTISNIKTGASWSHLP